MLWCRLAFFAAASMLVSAAHAQTTITFRFNDPEAPQMRQALDEFEKANPDIKVTLQRVAGARRSSNICVRPPSAPRRMSRSSRSAGPDLSAPPEHCGRSTI